MRAEKTYLEGAQGWPWASNPVRIQLELAEPAAVSASNQVHIRHQLACLAFKRLICRGFGPFSLEFSNFFNY